MASSFRMNLIALAKMKSIHTTGVIIKTVHRLSSRAQIFRLHRHIIYDLVFLLNRIFLLRHFVVVVFVILLQNKRLTT